VRPLTLDQAYQAAYIWLDHIGAAPTSIAEPANGVVELRCEAVLARVRWSENPIGQAAVLALLRARHGEDRLALFSVAGFTPGAVSLANTQVVALLRLDESGGVHAENPHAQHMMPEEAPPAPFASAARPAAAAGDHVMEPPAPPPGLPTPGIEIEIDPDDWIDCPRCGLTHHHRSNFCMSCGANLHESPALSTPPAPEGGDRTRPVPPAPPGAPTLRCRTCGSDDIELIHPGYASRDG